MSPRKTRTRPPRTLDAERRQGVDPDPVRDDELEHDLAGDDLQRLPHLARDVVAHLRHVADEVEVAAAGVGHALEQGLVEVGADAERAGRDAPVAELVREPLELGVVDDPDVREAVGEQQDAVHAVGGEVARPPARSRSASRRGGSVLPRASTVRSRSAARARSAVDATDDGTTTSSWSS